MLLAGRAPSQQSTGSLKGSVTDQLGGLVADATVVIKNGRDTERTVTTDAFGNYEFRALAPGRYDLTITAVGFNRLEEKNVELRAGKTTTLDSQLTIGAVEQTVTIDNKGLSTEADRNADALILRERELEALPNDPEALAAALQAMAGPSMGEGGAQVKVDGFSNGQIPPKETIREVRINQNPYSAENEYPGWGGIEIFTQPGSDKFHGGLSYNFNDESLNSRNPFALRRAPYQLRIFGVNLTGPLIRKRASFSLNYNRFASESNAIINATRLDPITLEPTRFNQTVVTPNRSDYFSFRGDLKVNKKHTLVSSYSFNGGEQDPAGIGGFSLLTRAYQGSNASHTLQITDTAVINEKTINETRLQIIHSVNRQTAKNTLFALNVQDSFLGGGSQVGAASNTQDRAELQNFTSWQTGKHFLKVGGRFRFVKIKSVAPTNFGGTYTFAGGAGPALDANNQVVPGTVITLSSIERYRRTLLFQQQNLSPPEIRSLGGGATQFSIAGGNPQAAVNQSDVSFYLQDEWKLRPHLTISPGLRYENQNNISSDLNFAPRVGFAWSPMFGGKKEQPRVNADAAQTKPTEPAKPAKPEAPKQPKTVVRGGFGIFYNRISEDLILTAERFNGINQRQFVVTDPSVLNLFPLIPPISLLDAFAQPQTRRLLSDELAPNYSLRTSVGVEHQVSRNFRFEVIYSHSRTLRNLRTVNINAPLGGTFNPAVSTSGVRPLGQSAGNILESQSNGRGRFDSVSFNTSGTFKKIGFWATYFWSKTRNLDNGTSGSPHDAYDFRNEWGRANFDIRHRFYANASYQTKSGWAVNSFVIASSGQPVNITIGKDTNGDTFFSERPAFATDLSKPGVVVTPLGALDPNPTFGQQIIPRNFGEGPGYFSVNVGLSKTIKFGRAIPPKAPPNAAAGAVVTTTGAAPPVSGDKAPAKPPVQRPYSLLISLYANNAFNRNNRSNLVGNMASPFFLRSTSTSGIFFSGPGGFGGSGGNRQLSLRVRLSF